MDTTVRNLDEQAYRALRARALLEGRTVGDLLSEAIREYLARGIVKRGTASLRALRPEPYPKGNEQLSSEIDGIVYGAPKRRLHSGDPPSLPPLRLRPLDD